MKKILLYSFLGAAWCVSGQTFQSIATDGAGDDYSFGMDATGMSYAITANQDSLYVRIDHAVARGSDFGFAMALDTNLNPNDGQSINQTNIANGMPNTSMRYDLLFYAYQNGFFPGVFTEAYDPSGNLIPLNFELDTVDPFFSVFKFALTDLGNKRNFNLIGFTGAFDISASGPSDAIPNSTFAQIRENIGTGDLAVSPGYSVYPNPAREFFYIEGFQDNIPLLIISLTGQVVDEIVPEEGRFILSRKLSGLFIVRDKQGLFQRKMIFRP